MTDGILAVVSVQMVICQGSVLRTAALTNRLSFIHLQYEQTEISLETMRNYANDMEDLHAYNTVTSGMYSSCQSHAILLS